MSHWPSDGAELLRELVQHPGRLALILAGASAESVATAFASLMGAPPLQVGEALVSGDQPPAHTDILEAMSPGTVLTDMEILFEPALGLDPVAILHRLARTAPRIALWPGRIEGNRVMYSELGRRDYFEQALHDVIILRPKAVSFPDQTPYDLERI